MKSQSNAANDVHDAAREAAYRGPERRRHRVFVTRNTEYHFRDGFCIAVRDRRTGDFLEGHLALHRRISGGLKFFGNGGITPNGGEPQPGESLYFAGNGGDADDDRPAGPASRHVARTRELVTSPLENVVRPSRDLVDAYPRRRK
jgi:hypothetical protein